MPHTHNALICMLTPVARQQLLVGPQAMPWRLQQLSRAACSCHRADLATYAQLMPPAPEHTPM